MKPELKLQMKGRRVALAALFVLLSGSFARADHAAYDPAVPAPLVASEKAKDLEGVGIDEQRGSQIDLNLKFTDENGEIVTLAKYFDGGHQPVIISPVYYSCPGLCNFHLNALTDGMKQMDWTLGEKFKALAISFDAREDSKVAMKKKASYLKLYDRPVADKDWHFLTGDQATIKTLMASLGFKYKWSDEANEWAHASAAIIVTPDGKISRYLPGLQIEPKDLKLALNEASSGKIGTIVDQLVLYCFQYNPHQSKYTLYAFNVMKVGGALMVLVLALWLLPIWIRSRRAVPKAARS
jgi:protein SCO1/2